MDMANVVLLCLTHQLYLGSLPLICLCKKLETRNWENSLVFLGGGGGISKLDLKIKRRFPLALLAGIALATYFLRLVIVTTDFEKRRSLRSSIYGEQTFIY